MGGRIVLCKGWCMLCMLTRFGCSVVAWMCNVLFVPGVLTLLNRVGATLINRGPGDVPVTEVGYSCISILS